MILVEDARSSTNLGDVIINVGCGCKTVVKDDLLLSDHSNQTTMVYGIIGRL